MTEATEAEAMEDRNLGFEDNNVEEVMAVTDNMELWNKVCTTDPSHTKKVTLGRTFTAIDPMYQIMNATQHMGVAGEGWGFSVEDVKFLPTDQVAVKVRIWRDKRENYIEQWGQNGLYIDNAKNKPDTDCMKKATTDGITKGLTYFGFNADVFLGKFDDNKYVAELEQQKKKEEEKPNPRIEELYNDLTKKMLEFEDGVKFKTWWTDTAADDRQELKALCIVKSNVLINNMKTKCKEFEKLTAVIQPSEFGQNFNTERDAENRSDN